MSGGLQSRLALALLIAGCGGSTRPRELVRFEALRAQPAAIDAAARLPKLTAEADALFAQAEAAYDAGRPQDAAHFARLARYGLWRAEAWAERKAVQLQLAEASNRLRLLDAKLTLARHRERAANERRARDDRLADYRRRVGALPVGPARLRLEDAVAALRGAFAADSGRLAAADEVQAIEALDTALLSVAPGRAPALAAAESAATLCERLQGDVAPRFEEERQREAAEARLREALAAAIALPEVEARLEARGLVLTLRQLFADGTVEIMPHRLPLVDGLAALIRPVADLGVRVESHSDARADPAAALRTTLARASSVRTRLIAAGLPEDRLAAAGHGGQDPIADNRTPEGRARNRRIEIVVLRYGAAQSSR